MADNTATIRLPDLSQGLVEDADLCRHRAYRKLAAGQRRLLGQYSTPPSVARFMASMCLARQPVLNLLDAGAGVGSLTAAFVDEICQRPSPAREIWVWAYEIDEALIPHLDSTLELCEAHCRSAQVRFQGCSHRGNFVEEAVGLLSAGLFGRTRFNCAIINPPYCKLSSDSLERSLLRSVGIEASNLYSAFLALTIRLLDEGGELVAITPRSFCNGPYFRAFRRLLLKEMAITRIHVFESRDRAFAEDHVLQENIILHAVKTADRNCTVLISSSESPADDDISLRQVEYSELVKPNDPESFIHIVPNAFGQSIADSMQRLGVTLPELGIAVSTGRVVDFRARPYLRQDPSKDSVPLIHPAHFSDGWVRWPKVGGKKPNALIDRPEVQDLLVPSGAYVLVKRFSAKEEARRIMSAVFRPETTGADRIGFENHLNYFHAHGRGLPLDLAKGLAAFLNSTLADQFFRQFSGHTQVNASDLRNFRYPTRSQLETLGSHIGDSFPDQETLDSLVEKGVFGMSDKDQPVISLRGRQKVQQALDVLRQLGLPRQQQNERSALTLLALLGLKPRHSWNKASNPLMGITPLMDYFATNYGKQYAPNTRETVRRQTIHQFVQAGIVIMNPDQPRPVNSPDNVYQVEPTALGLLRSYKSPQWENKLAAYKELNKTLQEKYAAERKMRAVSVTLPDGSPVVLSAGKHNVLIKHIIGEFCGYFVPGGRVLYLGDCGDKYAVWDSAAVAKLGVNIDQHGKMPDVVVHHQEKNWLVLIESVTTHGPVNAKRHNELKKLFGGSTAGLVFVTAFLDRRTMVRYLEEICWETEVWVAESPTHIIHFNGERFLGPYA